MTDIDREAVELAARWLHIQHGMFPEGDLILALRAALDRAEADKAAAVEAMRMACAEAAYWAVVKSDSDNHGTLAELAEAAIRNGGAA